jgi:prolyl oligopeptidase
VAIARVEPVVETLLGRRLVDPYRWMEQDGAERRAWLEAQADRAAEYLNGLPVRDELLARVTELTAASVTVRGFAAAGRYLFFLRQDGGGGVPVLAVRPAEDAGGDGRVVLDPARFAVGAEHCALDWYTPSPDGLRVACGLSRSDSERSVLRVLDMASGELDRIEIPDTDLGVVAWLPDGSGLTYHRFPQPDSDGDPTARQRESATFLHRFDGSSDGGFDGGADTPVMARGLNSRMPLAPTDRPLLVLPPGSDWMIAVISHSALGDGPITEDLSDCTLYAAPRAALADPASCPWRAIAGPDDAVTAFAVHADTLYAVSHRDAPRSQVLACSLSDGRGEVVVPGGERVVQAVRVVGDHLLVRDLDGGIARLRRWPLAGGVAQEVPLPVQGAMPEWTSGADGASALLVLTSWTRSPAAYRYDVRDGSLRDTGWIAPSPVDFGGIEVRELRVSARDGVPVPLTVLHRRDLPLDGNNPTLLTGYGSYGWAIPHRFTPDLLARLERGGVYALAGVRGGGEYGPAWHQAGRGAGKERTITDFIDCAEHLVAAGYTRSARLAGGGSSAGSIPTGGALVRRPDLWAAMVMRVPVPNTTRMEFTENGPINVPEFGSVTTEDGLRDLLIIDSYLRVEDGTPYPAVLLTAGLNDARVAVWQPAKMAARLQAATGSARPVLLRIDAHAGHGVSSTRAQRNAVTADMYAFLLAQLTDDPLTFRRPLGI